MFFPDHKTADKKKSFLSNYVDHVKYKTEEFTGVARRIMQSDNVADITEGLAQELAKRWRLDEALYDKYDYADEIVGATLLPVVAATSSLAALLAAAFWGVRALASMALYKIIELKNLCREHKSDTSSVSEAVEHHKNEARQYAVLAAVGLIITLFVAIKSWLSLLSRPAVTLWNGWQEPQEDRFHSDDSVVGLVGNFMGS